MTLAAVAASTPSDLIPSTYAEMYAAYAGLVASTVRKGGIAEQDVDDVSHSILLRIIERDALSAYDPEMRHDTPSGQRTARFGTFLAATVKSYLPGYRDRQRTHERRCHALVLTHDDGTESAPGGEVADHADQVVGTIVRDEIVSSFDHEPVRGHRDLGRAMRIMAAMVEREGVVSRSALAAEMGCSRSTAQNIIADIIDLLTIRGLTPAAMRAAAADETCYAQ